jgi:hypothetical protein
MAKKKTGQTVTLTLPATDETEILEDVPEEQDTIRAIKEMEGADDANFIIWRVLPATNQGYCGEMTAAEFTMKGMAEQFGPGKYKVRAQRSNGQYLKQTSVVVASPARPTMTPAATPAGSSAVQDVLAIIKAEKESDSERRRDLMLTLAPVLAGPAVELCKLLFGRKDNSMTEVVGLMRELNGLQPKQRDADPLSQISQVKEIMATVKEMLPEKESTGSTWVDLVRDGINQLGLPLLSAIQMRQAGGAPAAPLQPLPTPPLAQPQLQQPPPAPPPTTQDNNNPMIGLIMWLRSQLPLMLQAAQRNGDPALYAEVMADSLPPNTDRAVVKNALLQPNWFQGLAQMAPQIQPYEGWFTQLRHELVRMIDDAERDDALAAQHGAAGQDGEAAE